MTPVEAIEKIKRLQEPEPRALLHISQEMCEALEMAIEALEKQTPMKPLPEEMDVFGRTVKPCGYCGADLGRGYFCQWCGQRIDK